jgi:hypothetical protein
MEAFKARLASFEKPKRVKYVTEAGKAATMTLKWPHKDIRATPESLAQAGFYWNPSAEDGEEDNVRCFLCNKELSEWGARDDPFDIHWAKCGLGEDACAWAVARCGIEQDLDENGK